MEGTEERVSWHGSQDMRVSLDSGHLASSAGTRPAVNVQWEENTLADKVTLFIVTIILAGWISSLHMPLCILGLLRYMHAVLCCVWLAKKPEPQDICNNISPTFSVLQHTIQQWLKDLACYVDENWIQSSVWPPQWWSVYKETVRTSNDTEGNRNTWPPF